MIKIGDKIPSATLLALTPMGVEKVELSNILKGKKVVLFGLPGAFTPTCSKQHLKGFIEQADKIKDMGIDEIIGVAVNDVFVIDAWDKLEDNGGKVLLLSDWDAKFSNAMGLTFDGSAFGLGTRSLRYNAFIVDGVLKRIDVEEDPSSCGITSAEQVLDYL